MSTESKNHEPYVFPERRLGGNHRYALTPKQHAAEIVGQKYGWVKPKSTDFKNDEFTGGEPVRKAVQKLFGHLHEGMVNTEIEDHRIKPYKAHYDHWPVDMRNQYPWARVRIRLLSDTAEGGESLLIAAEGLVKALFFGMDAEGNPLFTDGEEDPRDLPNCGLKMNETRAAIGFKQIEGKSVHTGYEMFSADECSSDKGKEIKMLEGFTGKPFVQSRDGNEKVFSWIKVHKNSCASSENNVVEFYPDQGCAKFNVGYKYGLPTCGVRRLLRGVGGKW